MTRLKPEDLRRDLLIKMINAIETEGYPTGSSEEVMEQLRGRLEEAVEELRANPYFAGESRESVTLLVAVECFRRSLSTAWGGTSRY